MALALTKLGVQILPYCATFNTLLIKIWLLLLSELMFEFYHLSFNNLPFFFYFLRSFLLWSQLSTLKSVGLLPHKLQRLGLQRLYCSAAIFSLSYSYNFFLFSERLFQLRETSKQVLSLPEMGNQRCGGLGPKSMS